MLDCLISQLLMSVNINDAKHWLEVLGKVGTIPERHSEKLRESFSSNDIISKNDIIRNAANDLLKNHGMEPIPDLSEETFERDEIPF